MPLPLSSPIKKVTRRDDTFHVQALRVFGQKIPCGNFSSEKTFRYRRPSCGWVWDLASEATYDA